MEMMKMPESPFAKYSGELILGQKAVDCYVLDTEARVISLRATVRAISNDDRGEIARYIGAKSLSPYLDPASVTSGIVEFTIPGLPTKGKGITAETFLEICSAYVAALSGGANLTEKQRATAINCSILLSACAKTGLIALIDEATGYQYVRQSDALQVKIRAFISDELREWEKTFPDELWEEFGRLTGWAGSLHQRPKYWGKLVLELIYDALDPDVAEYLKTNKPTPRHGQNYHQWFTSDYGVNKLVTHIHQIMGIAKTCVTMDELRHKVALYYKKDTLQLAIGDNLTAISANVPHTPTESPTRDVLPPGVDVPGTAENASGAAE